MSRGDEDIAILQSQFNKGLITEEEYDSRRKQMKSKIKKLRNE